MSAQIRPKQKCGHKQLTFYYYFHSVCVLSFNFKFVPRFGISFDKKR